MNIIGRYVRIKQPINGVGDARNEERIDVVEDEIIRILSAKEDSWFVLLKFCSQMLNYLLFNAVILLLAIRLSV